MTEFFIADPPESASLTSPSEGDDVSNSSGSVPLAIPRPPSEGHPPSETAHAEKHNAHMVHTLAKTSARECRTPDELPPVLTQVFLRAMSIGLPPNLACDLIGLPYARYQDWMRMGFHAAPGDVKAASFTAFFASVKRSESAGHFERLDIINKAAQVAGGKGWRAAAWLEERLLPQHFGDRLTIDVDWRIEVVDALKHGLIQPQDILNELPYSEATALLGAAGIVIEGEVTSNADK